MLRDVTPFEGIINYHFKEVNLLSMALTHSSFANESEDSVEHNERLEFLGDAVLELCVSEKLIAKFPEAPEGVLTRKRAKVVSANFLAGKARQLGLDQYLSLGRGEEAQGGRTRNALLSDALEAMFGAVFLDGGYEAARRVILEIFADDFDMEAGLGPSRDFKSRLQELSQKAHRARPVYVLSDSRGPEHAKIFEITLTLPTGQMITAEGASLKQAEQKAAQAALRDFFEEGDSCE